MENFLKFKNLLFLFLMKFFYEKVILSYVSAFYHLQCDVEDFGEFSWILLEFSGRSMWICALMMARRFQASHSRFWCCGRNFIDYFLNFLWAFFKIFLFVLKFSKILEFFEFSSKFFEFVSKILITF